MRSPAELLQDILDAIERVERYAARGRQAFDSDELIQTWIVHHIEIIGEAAGRLGRTFHDAHPAIAWPQVVAMRNVPWLSSSRRRSVAVGVCRGLRREAAPRRAAGDTDIDQEELADVLDVWDIENRQRSGTFSSTTVDRYRFGVRAPFLERELVDHLRQAPPGWRVQQRAYKQMIVSAFAGAARAGAR